MNAKIQAAAVVTLRGIPCNRRSIVRGIRGVRFTDPTTGENLKGMRAVGAACGAHSSTISRRLAAGGILASDATGIDIEAALCRMLPGDVSAYRATSAAAAQPVQQSQPCPHPTRQQPYGPTPTPQQIQQVQQHVGARINPGPQPQPTPQQQRQRAQQQPVQPVPVQPTYRQHRAAAQQPPAGATGLDALTLQQFAARIHKPLADARKAIQSGALDSVCGLRKAALVCKISGVLERDGWARRDALAAAYYSAVVAKEPADQRLHVVEPFVAEFGFEPKLPTLSKVAEDPTRPGQWLHPVVPFLATLLREGIHVWLYGEAGVGKSRAARDAARLLQRTATTFACHKHTHTDDALGGKELEAGATVDRMGPWPTAMQGGHVLILEEPSKAHPGVLAVAHAMLEEGELHLPTAAGEATIHAAPGFACVAADNAEAGRDPGRYVAVNQMDPAFLDRFAMVEVGALPVAAELSIMLAAFGGAA